jgi:hypothetical protein
MILGSGFIYICNQMEKGKCLNKRDASWYVEKSRNKWEENITLDIGEIEWEGVDWIHLGQDRDQWQALMKMVMHLWVL